MNMGQLKFPRGAADSELASPSLKSHARGLLGAGNWIQGQSRADLSALVSLGQQRMGSLTVGDCRKLNAIVRRARQFRDLGVIIPSVALNRLMFSVFTDASFQNGPGGSTQAGTLVVVSDKDIAENRLVDWGPLYWRSHKLRRRVGSTLAAEAMSALEGQGVLEWCKSLWLEMTSLKDRDKSLSKLASLHIIDAKSLWGHVKSSSPSAGVEDRRAGIDLVLLKQCIQRTESTLRWGPTSNMLADVLTKDDCGPVDTWRGYMSTGKFGLVSEEESLRIRAEAKAARQERGAQRQKQSETEGQETSRGKLEEEEQSGEAW